MCARRWTGLAGLCALGLVLTACTRHLPIEKIYAENTQVIYAFDARFEGPAFGYVRGEAKQHCQTIALDQVPVLMGQTKTLNGISYAEFWCVSSSLEGIPPATLPNLSARQTRKTRLQTYRNGNLRGPNCHTKQIINGERATNPQNLAAGIGNLYGPNCHTNNSATRAQQTRKA